MDKLMGFYIEKSYFIQIHKKYFPIYIFFILFFFPQTKEL